MVPLNWHSAGIRGASEHGTTLTMSGVGGVSQWHILEVGTYEESCGGLGFSTVYVDLILAVAIGLFYWKSLPRPLVRVAQ